MMAYALIGQAMAGHGGGEPGWSARLHGAATQALADLGGTVEPLEGRLADVDRRRLRAVMGAGAFEAEDAAGRTLDPAQVLAELGSKDAAAGEPRVAHQGEAATVLTPGELDVLKLVAQGLSNPGIARHLVLSEHTVHRHLANILRKLGLSSRAAAAAWACAPGWREPGLAGPSAAAA
jgi:DNA-binding CsgD family transcriptional regulator